MFNLKAVINSDMMIATFIVVCAKIHAIVADFKIHNNMLDGELVTLTWKWKNFGFMFHLDLKTTQCFWSVILVLSELIPCMRL